MEIEFSITRKSREIYTRFLQDFTLEQLNKVPQGFSNNLIWNIGHIIVSQQMLVYSGSGQQPLVSQHLLNRYMRGTRPERDVTQEEVDEIKALLLPTIDKTEQDYNNRLFTAYTERKTQLGFLLTTVEDGIVFNNYHEGIHLGIMMQLRKFI